MEWLFILGVCISSSLLNYSTAVVVGYVISLVAIPLAGIASLIILRKRIFNTNGFDFQKIFK